MTSEASPTPMTNPTSFSTDGGGATADSTVPEYQPGTHVHHYELIRKLGSGAMGHVFLARDTKLGRLVAMKFMATKKGEMAQRFVAEARTTARFNHENIVVIHDVDEHEGHPYMVLEYLEGQTVRAIIDDDGLPWTRAVALILPVVRALHRAHQHNIVHRDLKPENVFVTDEGVVKVLDFGIAKLLDSGSDSSVSPATAVAVAPSPGAEHRERAASSGSRASGTARASSAIDDFDPAKLRTQQGALVGTMAYMSPEQWGADAVDHRADIWAAGMILFEMLAGQHPLAPVNQYTIVQVAFVDDPMPSIVEMVDEIPAELAAIVDKCLHKRKNERYADAAELLDALERVAPASAGRGRLLDGDRSPYAGLSAFQESDAERFFGRSRDVARMVARLRERPLTGVVGPSGVGKSSFIRAGVIPALQRSGKSWEVFSMRPGRYPLAGLATLLHPLTTTQTTALTDSMDEHQALIERLRAEPGYLGRLLRSRAQTENRQIMLVVDQFEELYTLVPDIEQRTQFTRCLGGVADDPTTPLRVVIAMRSDFLDRVAEDQDFIDELTRGLMFLSPPDREGLHAALVQPAAMCGYAFESEDMVEDMLDALSQASGALPLLQFAASKLWDERDRERKLFTRRSYDEIGGVAGALASHADAVLSELPVRAQKQARAVLLRLVTADRTRDIVSVTELGRLGAGTEDAERIVRHLVGARLIVVQTGADSDEPAAELVHESLIEGWPTLRRWLDESHEDSVFLAELRQAAKQWRVKGRPPGLLWRAEAADDARRHRERVERHLGPEDRAFLDAVLALDSRARRRKRLAIIGTIGFLVAVVIVGGIGLLQIREARNQANDQADLARTEAERARAAELESAGQLQVIRNKEAARLAAEQQASSATAAVAMTREQLRKANRDLNKANATLQRAVDEAAEKARLASEAASEASAQRQRAESESARAQNALKTAEQANAKLEKLTATLKKQLAKETARAKMLERERGKITTELK